MFIEENCTFVHKGRGFTSGGAAITEKYLVAYLGKAGVLTDWHGNEIGTYRIISTWKTPRSFLSSSMSAVHARVDGRLYKGRSAGEGMIFSGRLAAVAA